MPFVVDRVGQIVGSRADRIAIAQFASANPEVITLVWNGSHVKHTLWSLLPTGDLVATELHSQSGGPDLDVASFSNTRLVSMHRAGPDGALKFEAWRTGGIFDLSDDAIGPSDRDPDIVPFGGDAGIIAAPLSASVKTAASGVRTAALAAKKSGGAAQTGQTSPPAHKPIKSAVPAGTIGVKLAPKTGHAVVASITDGNHLRLSLWGFDNGGDIKVLVGKYAEADGGSATAVSVAKVKELWVRGPKLKGVEVVTASRGGGYALKVQRWRITLGSQNVPVAMQLLGEQTAAEKITHVSAVPVLALSGTQVATAVRLDDGTLKIIGWKMESDGSISRWVEASGGSISAVSAALVRGRHIVTAVREADGRFKASYWRFPSDVSGALEYRGGASEGQIGPHVRCTHVPDEGTDLGDTVAATQTEDGKLQLFRYRVTDA